MSKKLIDKNICNSCKLGPPDVEILHIKGKPRGLCKSCRNLRERTTRSKHSIYKDFYYQQKALFSLNYKILFRADFKVYPILHRIDRKREGYLVNQKGKVFINIYGKDYLFGFDLFGVSTWLSNQNLMLDDKSIELVGPEDKPVDLRKVGEDLMLKDVTELLVMYDVKLRDYAIAQVKKELAETKLAMSKLKKK